MDMVMARMSECAIERAAQDAGFRLTTQQVGELAEVERACLQEAQRVSLGATAAPVLIEALVGSPCLTGADAFETLSDLTEAFYDLRGDFPAQTTDLEIIDALKETFDGEAQGDVPLAASLARDALAPRDGLPTYEIADDFGAVYRWDPDEWCDDIAAAGWDGERWDGDYE